MCTATPSRRVAGSTARITLAVMPVLNVSSGVTWLELDEKLFWNAMLCCKKASFAMFSPKSVQLHDRALLAVGIAAWP